MSPSESVLRLERSFMNRTTYVPLGRFRILAMVLPFWVLNCRLVDPHRNLRRGVDQKPPTARTAPGSFHVRGANDSAARDEPLTGERHDVADRIGRFWFHCCG